MSTKTIILISEDDHPDHRRVTVLPGPPEAERLVETLLESGVAPERIQVYSGVEMGVQITYRPVVALGRDSASSRAALDEASDAPGEPAPAVEGQPDTATLPAERGFARNGASPMVDMSVRFSSLFRSVGTPPWGERGARPRIVAQARRRETD